MADCSDLKKGDKVIDTQTRQIWTVTGNAAGVLQVKGNGTKTTIPFESAERVPVAK